MGGTVVNHRYRLDAEAGWGGMGMGYGARDLLLHRDVAIRLLNETSLGSEARAHLLREAQATAHLNDPSSVVFSGALSARGGPRPRHSAYGPVGQMALAKSAPSVLSYDRQGSPCRARRRDQQSSLCGLSKAATSADGQLWPQRSQI